MKGLIIVGIVIMSYFTPIEAQQNKVVLITGASRNLGLETAELLAEKGFIVYATTRSSPPQSKETIHFLSVDLKDERSIQNGVQTILDEEGRVDILINNAGFAIVGPVESFTELESHEQMEVNFFAPIRFIQAVLPTMRSQKSGHIVNISSVNAFQTPPFGSVYAASKAALESLSESLCIELQPFNISVSNIEPGLIQTNFSLPIGTRNIPDNPYQKIMDDIQKDIEGRMAHPELLSPSQTAKEIADFILSVVQDPHPKLRYQTSENAKQLVSKKLLDLTGDIYIEEVRKFTEAKKEDKKTTENIIKVVVDYSPSQFDNAVISEGIIASNAHIVGERDKAFSIFLKNDSGKVFGGLQAFLDSESVYIDVLWVEENLQKKGYGTKLLKAAEQEAINNRCKYITVDTWDFQAEEFYLKNGYERLGELKNYWHGHSKIFLRKKTQ
jgi:NAD(P)-dependent dehydrogenase (short-subunit alcohol dehydrogenase family)/GNAT superfamily N-acetyltransferase